MSASRPPAASLLEAVRVGVGGYPFVPTTFEAAVSGFVSFCLTAPRGVPVRLVNAYSVAVAHGDSAYAAVLRGPGTNLPDGTPLALLLRLKARRVARAERVRGPSFFAAVLGAGQAVGLRHYLLGTTGSTLDALTAAVAARFPDAVIAGSWAPPFGPLDDAFEAEALARVRASGPHVVWLGLGTPKQDFAAVLLAASLDVPVVGVGAAFDFVAGTVREPPVWIQRSGFEWFYRLVREPRRLWRRYLIGNVRFLVAVGAAEWHEWRSRRATS